ncbi:MAG TPA: hypothetical protein VGM56_04310 [Byssovorax sp.]
MWLAAAASGLGALTVYAAQPGAGAVASAWPGASRLPRPTRPTLVMMLHPECPCSRASVAELERLQARTSGAFDVVLLVVTRRGGDPAFLEAPIARAAAAVQGARVVEDPGGVESARFGAQTSGQAIAFDASGAVVFRGGLTAARGHEGDNDGTDALAAIARRAAPRTSVTPVFGCSLSTPQGDVR